ncbi:CaiB/BaiF CoA transferase family protein [Robertmurraya kyonggiensis]|uniref:CoA transferase n=1 Tax=Robertmurraya kyonggiensis TaxID=1037680 RepID=A0A4U1DC15_9BACI|nr:CaiB/BaiF CoA-transferase family protein [Robertmurraya kyonggiensis]TKC20161.1 CoA transferase [Robertmurraya kyonggiensis]
MPLEGIRVLDLTRLLPGPYASLMLADFGADVIKIEDPKVGDYARWGEPKIHNYSAMFHSLNRNKRSMALDLKSENGKTIFLELVMTADVLIESFRPGVMERLNLGYEVLKSYNPKLIYCAITGYGQTGPLRDVPGHDINFLSYSGVLDLQKGSDGHPVTSPVQIGDIGGGALMATVGILTAIIEAGKSGEGQFVDISMLDGTISWMQTTLPNYLATNERPVNGELLLSGGMACYEIYETRDKRFLSVGAIEPKFWINFCKVIGKAELISQLNASFEEQKRMKMEIQSAIEKKTLQEWVVLFQDVDACVSPVLTIAEMVEHPQILQRQMIEEVQDLNSLPIRHIANPIKLSRTPAIDFRNPPDLGEHNEEVLEELGIIRDLK